MINSCERTQIHGCSFAQLIKTNSVIVRIFHEVGDPHLWSAESRASYGSAPAVRHWLIYVEGESAGLLTLRAEPVGEIEVVSFGLVPDRQGHGFGGPALTLAVDLAWTVFGGEVSRVWLHTNDFDHSSALPNSDAELLECPKRASFASRRSLTPTGSVW